MKKNKKTEKQKKASVKRGSKRAVRLKKTQGEKHIKKLAALEEKKKIQKKEEEELMKILQSRPM